MLVLTLKRTERVAIGDPKNPGWVQVVDVIKDGTQYRVRLGFTFDRSIPVNREEIVERILAGEQR